MVGFNHTLDPFFPKQKIYFAQAEPLQVRQRPVQGARRSDLTKFEFEEKQIACLAIPVLSLSSRHELAQIPELMALKSALYSKPYSSDLMQRARIQTSL